MLLVHSESAQKKRKQDGGGSTRFFRLVMGFEIDGWKDVAAACCWKAAAKPCDGCSSAGAVLFCQVDSAFLCLDCDSEIHGGGANSKRHRRVWMCEVCEQAPAAVFCKADAATLCVTCDHDIHTANPLAHRHDRAPVQPFVDSAVKSCSLGLVVPTSNVADPPRDHEINSTWLLPTSNLSSKFDLEEHDMKSADLFSTKVDPFSDFEYQNSFHHQIYCNAAMDSVVPAQVTIKTVPDHHPVSHISMTNSENCFDIDFCSSKITALTHSHHPISQTVSSSSLEVGLVPDGNFSDTSFSFGRPERSGVVSGNTGCQTGKRSGGGGFDREARVLRYREKRKNRKFEKTIRYASRKAYAESRPRIKGRFAKRTAEMESEAGAGIFSSDQSAVMAFLADTYYGVVPSF